MNQTPLFYAARVGNELLIRLLLQQNVKVNHTDTYRQTPLFYAVKEGNIASVKVLIEQGADPDFVDNEG